METAYCPYCGGKIAVRGQPCCPHCAADIIDIWKLLDSNLQPPSPVRPAPSKPRPFDWIGPAFIITLGLALFVLAAYLALPWLAANFLPGSAAGRAREFVAPGGAGQIGAPVVELATPTPTAVPMPVEGNLLLEDGQVVYLKCLGHLEGNRWLSADPAESSVYLAASPDDIHCCCCWQVINPDHDNTIQLALVNPAGTGLYLNANPQTEQIWLSPPAGLNLTQTWEVVQHPDGSFSLLNLSDGPERYLDGLTVDGRVALAPAPDTYYTGAYWEVQPVPVEILLELSEPEPAGQATRVISDPCLTGSRLSIGMKAAVIEGGGRNRLRKNPSLSAKIIELIPEGDPVKILDGPECNDGLVWWRVRVLETGATGWTAEMRDGDYYLRPLD